MKLVISGGQTGADLGGIAGAIEARIPVLMRIFEGFRPIGGRQIERMGLPFEYLDCFGTYVEKLRQRTEANVVYAEGTVVFVNSVITPGSGSESST
jgi:hypothetical protein